MLVCANSALGFACGPACRGVTSGYGVISQRASESNPPCNNTYFIGICFDPKNDARSCSLSLGACLDVLVSDAVTLAVKGRDSHVDLCRRGVCRDPRDIFDCPSASSKARNLTARFQRAMEHIPSSGILRVGCRTSGFALFVHVHDTFAVLPESTWLYRV
jgi:hypothetical protein